ncbi:MAG: serine/threonine protein phosphatase, partial [Psychrobacter sp.]|nr:serine/threonine protein phosphatase [Psychrobacter sp.]
MNIKSNVILPIASRLIAIGDIHGCFQEMEILIKAINMTTADTLVILGDYIDRGPDTRAVLDTIIELKESYNVICLLGNHEAMMREAFNFKNSAADRIRCAKFWLKNGGKATLDSYMFSTDDLLSEHLNETYLPASIQKHLDLINKMPLHYITDTHIFVHATPAPNKPIQEQDEMELTWRKAGKLDVEHGYTHISYKTIVSGHTAQISGDILKLSDKNIIIDSGCFATGWLTAMIVNDDTYLQASKIETRWLIDDNKQE